MFIYLSDGTYYQTKIAKFLPTTVEFISTSDDDLRTINKSRILATSDILDKSLVHKLENGNWALAD